MTDLIKRECTRCHFHTEVADSNRGILWTCEVCGTWNAVAPEAPVETPKITKRSKAKRYFDYHGSGRALVDPLSSGNENNSLDHGITGIECPVCNKLKVHLLIGSNRRLCAGCGWSAPLFDDDERKHDWIGPDNDDDSDIDLTKYFRVQFIDENKMSKWKRVRCPKCKNTHNIIIYTGTGLKKCGACGYDEREEAPLTRQSWLEDDDSKDTPD